MALFQVLQKIIYYCSSPSTASLQTFMRKNSNAKIGTPLRIKFKGETSSSPSSSTSSLSSAEEQGEFDESNENAIEEVVEPWMVSRYFFIN